MSWTISKVAKTALLSVFASMVCFNTEPVLVSTVAAAQTDRLEKPAFPGGGIMHLTFRSEVDGSLQPFLVKLPAEYTPTKSWPLLVTLHGLGDGPILAHDVNSIVQIGPYGRGSVWFTGIGKEDVFECVRTAKKLFSVDEDRVYLCGFSMGGAATFNLGLSYPDVWAACVAICGRCEDIELVTNGSELPFWINTGADDSLLPPECSRKAYRRAEELGFEHWRYTEHIAMGHSFHIDWKHVEQWLLGKKRAARPRRISFCTRSLDANKAYWVEITGVERYGEMAQIKAEIEGRTGWR